MIRLTSWDRTPDIPKKSGQLSCFILVPSGFQSQLVRRAVSLSAGHSIAQSGSQEEGPCLVTLDQGTGNL